jgi:hypothetical protein
MPRPRITLQGWQFTPDGAWALYRDGELVACVCRREVLAARSPLAGVWYVVSRSNGGLWQAVARARTLGAAKKWALA